MTGDRGGFMETIADLDEDFVARQARLFSRLIDLPLDSYRLRVAWERYGDLARPSDKRRYGTETHIPVTEERYRLRGLDDEPAVEDLYYTYVRSDGEWVIAEDTDLDQLALYSARHLWDSGSIEMLKSDHFVLFSHPCRAGRFCATRETLDVAESALTRVRRYWRSIPERVAVIVPASSAELERMIQATFDLEDFVAFAYSTVDLSGGIDYTGHRIMLNPAAFTGRGAASTGVILAHELLHVATRAAAGPFVPIFLDEGFADYVGYDADPAVLGFLNSELASGRLKGSLPQDFEFTIGTGSEILLQYQKSHSAVRFFIERWGLAKLRLLYRRLGRVAVAPGTVRFHIDRALRETVGVGFAAFERRWADSIGAS